jgi:hypothetical protein
VLSSSSPQRDWVTLPSLRPAPGASCPNCASRDPKRPGFRALERRVLARPLRCCDGGHR